MKKISKSSSILRKINITNTDPHRRGDIRAEIEQVVLDDEQSVRGRRALQRGDRDADRAVRLVDVADRLHHRGGFRHARSVYEARRARVAGARVDAVQLDHRAGVSGSGSAADEQDDDDDEDRQRLKEDAHLHHLVRFQRGGKIGRAHV